LRSTLSKDTTSNTKESTSICLKHYDCPVEDGSSIHLGLDWWHSDGILYEKYGYRLIYDARSKLEAKLANIMKGKEWDWQPARLESLVSTHSKLPLVKIGENDAPILVISKKCSYTIRETWEAIRTKQPRVTWWKPKKSGFLVQFPNMLLWCGWHFKTASLQGID
jgi:hypothetical protein